MVRILLFITSCMWLAACSSDGRGSQYSSARAAPPTPTYIPVTPGATPVLSSQAPVVITPASAQAPRTSPTPVTRASAPAPRAAPAPTPTRRAGSARGPIFSACQASGRKAATRARCGCVQWVADQELTAAQQRRGAGYFNNPHGLQEVRQSSERVRANGVFWEAWKAYGARAARQCQNA